MPRRSGRRAYRFTRPYLGSPRCQAAEGGVQSLNRVHSEPFQLGARRSRLQRTEGLCLVYGHGTARTESVQTACRVLGVSESGYIGWRSLPSLVWSICHTWLTDMRVAADKMPAWPAPLSRSTPRWRFCAGFALCAARQAQAVITFSHGRSCSGVSGETGAGHPGVRRLSR